MTDEPKNYTEIFQKEIAESLKVNKEARSQRLELEDSLKLDPFVEHLYSEGEFEKLIFFEMRKSNELLMKLVDLLSGAHKVPEVCISTVKTIEPSIEEITAKNAVLSKSGDLISYEQNSSPTFEQLVEDREKPMKHEPVDEETGIHQVESDGLSDAEKSTLANKETPMKHRAATARKTRR